MSHISIHIYYLYDLQHLCVRFTLHVSKKLAMKATLKSPEIKTECMVQMFSACKACTKYKKVFEHPAFIFDNMCRC